MDYRRIIPCLDVKDGRLVKGVNFVQLKDVGDPAENAAAYCEAGADELVFLDITATIEKRKTLLNAVKRTVESIEARLPLTVGGGIGNCKQIEELLDIGVSKVSINTAAVRRPVEELGAGAILPTSMDADGTQAGYDIPMTRAIAEAVSLAVIASGGAGTLEHLYQAIVEAHADAVLVASIAHFGTYTIRQMKEYLAERGIAVNL